MTIIRMKAHHNGGPGLWWDVYDRKVDAVDCESYSNFGVTAAWEGCGYATEICFGPTTFTTCYAHDNTGSDFAVWEAKNTTIKDCVSTGSGIELRNIGGDRGGAKMADRTKGWYVQNLTISGHRFYNAGRTFWSINSPFPGQISNITELGSARGLSLPATWATSDQPATQPATLPATQPADDPIIKVEPIGGYRVTHKGGRVETVQP
jgi:hypothetical protein